MSTPNQPSSAANPVGGSPPPPGKFRMSLRDLLILLVSLGAGVGADLLLAGANVPFGQAILGGCAAFAATLHFLDKIIA